MSGIHVERDVGFSIYLGVVGPLADLSGSFRVVPSAEVVASQPPQEAPNTESRNGPNTSHVWLFC